MSYRMGSVHVRLQLEYSPTVLVFVNLVQVYFMAALSVAWSVELLPALPAWMATICPQCNAFHVTSAALPVLHRPPPALPALKARPLMVPPVPA